MTWANSQADSASSILVTRSTPKGQVGELSLVPGPYSLNTLSGRRAISVPLAGPGLGVGIVGPARCLIFIGRPHTALVHAFK
jgi:hypothetical protein